MGNRDQDYYLRRVEQERAAAALASDPCARAAHLDLAFRYSEKLRLIGSLDSEASFAEPLRHSPVRGRATG